MLRELFTFDFGTALSSNIYSDKSKRITAENLQVYFTPVRVTDFKCQRAFGFVWVLLCFYQNKRRKEEFVLKNLYQR